MTRMKESGYAWRCACGWQTERLRAIEDLEKAVLAHRRWHDGKLRAIMRRSVPWDGKHHTTCPYEGDCPQSERLPA